MRFEISKLRVMHVENAYTLFSVVHSGFVLTLYIDHIIYSYLFYP
jgi:hypothetical protein